MDLNCNEDEVIFNNLCTANGIDPTCLTNEGSKLEKLEMFFSGFPRIISLNSFPNLSQLVIINQPISTIENLDMCTNLVSLWICECNIKAIGGLDQCGQIRNLYLYDNKITKIKNLYSLLLLEILWLNNNNIESIEGLDELIILKELNLAGNQIKSIGNSLINNISIETLDLSGNQLENTEDLLTLRKLHKLKYLILNGPDYLPNPVFYHTNYFLFIIYHFPNLKQFDTFDVSSNYLKDIVLNIINKKKLFYFMKIESIDRDMSFTKFQLRVMYNHLCENQKMRLSDLSKLSKLIEMGRLAPADNIISGNENLEINTRIDTVEICIKSLQTELQFYLNKVDLHNEEMKILFQTEYSSCGNFKIETSSDKIWVNLCNELINSRFCNSEFGFEEFKQIKTHRVIKIKNIQIESNYEKSIQHFLDQSEGIDQLGIDDCKLQDYLFLVVEENDNRSLISILNWLSSAGEGEVIKATNSLSNGDIMKMKRNNSDDGNYYGRVLMVKAFVGFFKMNPDSDTLEKSSYYDTSRVPTKICENKNTCSCSNYKYDWYFKTNRLLVPEYIVDFEYIVGNRTKSPLYQIFHGIENGIINKSSLSSSDVDKDLDNIKKMLDFSEINNNFPILTCYKPDHPPENITTLNLTNACLENVSEISSLKNLSELIMPFNNLGNLKDISNRKLKILDVSFNKIQTLGEMHQLPELIYFNIQNNVLIKTKDEISILHNNIPNLIKLNVKYNLFQKLETVRLWIISGLKYLKILDGIEIDDNEIGLALELACKSQISKSQIIEFGRTDTVKPRTLLIDNMASILLSKSDNRIPSQITGNYLFLRITSLCLNDQFISTMSNMEKLENLKYLLLSNNLISKIEGLNCCTHLEELILDNNTIVEIENLAKLQKLKKLSLNENYIKSVWHLKNLPNIQIVSIHTNELTSFAGMEFCIGLTELYAANNCISDTTEVFILKSLNNLTLLDLHNNPITQTNKNYRLNMIFNLKHLKGLDGICVDNLEIYHSKDVLGGRLNLDYISEKIGNENYNILTELDLSSCALKSVDLAPVERLQHLRSMNLENNNLTSFSGLISMCHLRVLCLNSNAIESIIQKVSKTGIQPIQRFDNEFQKVNLKSLEVLHLGYNNIKSVIQLGLHDIPSLKALFLQGNDISTIDGLEYLVNLRELVLDQNRIKHISENSFINNSNMREIHLDDNRLKHLTYVYHLKYLKRLYVVNNRISDLQDLDLFYSFESLIDISLCGNPVGRRHQHRPYLIHMIPTLLMIDGIEVSDDERFRVEISIDENTDNNILPGILNQNKTPNTKLNSNFYNPNDFNKPEYLKSDSNFKKRPNPMNYYNFNNKTNSIQLVANTKTVYFYDPISQIESIPRLNLNKRK